LSIEQHIRQTIRDVPDFPKPGIMFKDITPIFYDQNLCSQIANEVISRLTTKPDAIVGVESRGFLFGFLVANKLNIPFVLARKPGKLPYKTVSFEYDLEYSSAKIEMHEDALQKGWNVLVHDDLLATGGTAAAAAQLINKLGAKVVGFNFIVGLQFLNGEEKLKNYSNNITCLVQY